jgi:hypothetical protein
MFSRLRKRFTYANVAMTLALVFAVTGGAYAASKYVITSTKQIKPSVLASLKGKAGPGGKEGPAGKEGKAGAQGPAGEKGAAGANGANGVSVTSTESKSKIGPCTEGGSEFKSAGGATYACYGKEGKEGSPWTAGGTLPSEQTEKGDWDLEATTQAVSHVATSVSFVVPLAKAPTPHYLRFANNENPGTAKEPVYNPTTEKEEEIVQPACPGTYREPEAAPGNLCVYASAEEGTFANLGALNPAYAALIVPAVCSANSPGLTNCAESNNAADKFGFDVGTIAEKEEVRVSGTWAVTAE